MPLENQIIISVWRWIGVELAMKELNVSKEIEYSTGRDTKTAQSTQARSVIEPCTN